VSFTVEVAGPEHWPGIWAVMEPILRAGETYTVDCDLGEAEARRWWMRPGARVLVALDGATVLGTAKVVRNFDGPGSHVANGSFMVAAAAGRRGVGRALGEQALAAARAAGYRAMQFNAVVETNTAAVALWRSLDFEILATVPEAFDHPRLGPVGLHVMHRRL
jgi:ribosomal protein S18 acetylase RimI-like enzyme